MRISDWSSDVFSSDLGADPALDAAALTQEGDDAAEVAAQHVGGIDETEVGPFRKLAKGLHAALRDGGPGRRGGRLAGFQRGMGRLLAAGTLRPGLQARSEERRAGQACVSTCRARWSP